VNEFGTVVYAEHSAPSVTVIVVAWRSSLQLFACLESIRAQRGTTAYEVVLVLNDVVREVADGVARHVRGATVIASRRDIGFAGSVNVAAGSARADLLVVVHDDVEVAPDWLDRLVVSAAAHPGADVIGCAVLAPADATASAGRADGAGDLGKVPGRSGAPGGRGPFRVSDCAFLLRRAAWERLGGLNEVFYPFGFVTRDLCARVVAAGGHVRVEPRASVRRHRSYRTSERFRRLVMALNGELFALRHAPADGLKVDRGGSTAEPPSSGPGVPWPATIGTQTANGATRSRARPHVLLIDDAVPDSSRGAGSGRMADVVHELTTVGRLPVDVLPLVATSEADPVRARALGAKVVRGDLEDLLGPDGRHYEIVIVSRPHNWAASIETLRRLARGTPIVYDAEALFHRRLERQIPYVVDVTTAIRVARDAAKLAAIERGIAREADYVVAISEEEADFFRENSPTARNVAVHPPFLAGSRATATGPATRRDIAFVAAWSAGPDSPNADALLWFARQILPRVRARLPGARLRVTGADPPLNVRRLTTRAIEFVGQVERLEDFYSSVRVVVVPVRFGSGVKLKTVEAVQFGVPTVATTVGAEGIPFDEPDAVVVVDDPVEFAGAVARFLGDDAIWESQRRQVLAQQAAWAARPAGSMWPSLVERLVRVGPPG
jgi:GT2 family glycosyltransferase